MKAGRFSTTDINIIWRYVPPISRWWIMRQLKRLFGRNWICIFLQDPDNPFYYETANGERIIPPDRMVTDLGSIPRLFHIIISVIGFACCYIIHDFLCVARKIEGEPTTRKRVDYILGESIFTLTKDALVRRFLVHRGVRFLAWYQWLVGKGW